MKVTSDQRRCCSVKNCQKVLEPGDQIVIGEQVLCKPCAVYYFKELLGADYRED
jgi:hypothetical protein